MRLEQGDSVARSELSVRGKRRLIAFLVVLLVILHYDFWFWGDRTLVFGFMPIGLFYQALISIAAAVAWWIVVRFAWPIHVEEWAKGDDQGSGD